MLKGRHTYIKIGIVLMLTITSSHCLMLQIYSSARCVEGYGSGKLVMVQQSTNSRSSFHFSPCFFLHTMIMISFHLHRVNGAGPFVVKLKDMDSNPP